MLGVRPDADAASIKAAYRRLALRFHPDHNPRDARADSRFALVAEAYRVLGDPIRRRWYDRLGPSGELLTDRDKPLRHRIARFVDAAVAASGAQASLEAPRSAEAPLVVSVRVPLRRAAVGTREEVRTELPAPCSECEGSGAATPGDVETCHVCGGSGRAPSPPPFRRRTVACPFCGATGRVVRAVCSACGGQGWSLRPRKLVVDVPAGTYESVRVTARDAVTGRTVHVDVVVEPDPLLEREGLDLRVRVPLTLRELLEGASVRVPTLKGSRALAIPAGTRPGTVLRVRGRGLPAPSGRRAPGDLFVEVVLAWPSGEARARAVRLVENWPAPAEHPDRVAYERALEARGDE